MATLVSTETTARHRPRSWTTRTQTSGAAGVWVLRYLPALLSQRARSLIAITIRFRAS